MYPTSPERPVPMLPISSPVIRAYSVRSYASSVSVCRFSTSGTFLSRSLRRKRCCCAWGAGPTRSSSSFSSYFVSVEPGWYIILPGSGNGSFPALGGTTSRVSFSRKDTSAELVLLRCSAGSHSQYVLFFVLYPTRCASWHGQPVSWT